MSRLLEEGIKAIRALSKERQDATGELLLHIAAQDESARCQLTEEQIAEVRAAVDEADRGEFVDDASMAEFWKSCGQ